MARKKKTPKVIFDESRRSYLPRSFKTPKVIFAKTKLLKYPKTPNTPKGRKRKRALQLFTQGTRKKRSVNLFVNEGLKENWRRFRRPLKENESKRRSNVEPVTTWFNQFINQAN